MPAREDGRMPVREDGRTPVREDGRTPVRDEGRAIPLDPVRLGGRGTGLSEGPAIFSILAAERKPLELVARPRKVGRVSLMEGVWLGLEGDVSRVDRSDSNRTKAITMFIRKGNSPSDRLDAFLLRNMLKKRPNNDY